jgi:hypothetical protein
MVDVAPVHLKHRPTSPWAIQIALACAMCAYGMFGAASVAMDSSTGGWSYWATENQTYRFTRSVALRELRISAVGLCWLMVLGFARLLLCLAAAAGRNNSPQKPGDLVTDS